MSVRTPDLLPAFVNAAVLGTGASEAFATPAGLRAWLLARRLLKGNDRVSEADRRRAVACREALRALLASKRAGAPPREALSLLRRQADRARFALSTDAGGPVLLPRAKGVDGALGLILLALLKAAADGSWRHLRACPNPTCRMAFVDRSRNHSRVWCEMAVCGNRAKARRFRRRSR